MSKIITHEMYVKMVEESNPYVKVVGQYTGMDNKIELKCLICGEHYFAKAYDAKIGKKHRKCSFIISTAKRTKTDEQFKEELSKIQPHIVPLEKYIHAKEKIKCYCTKHDEYFLGDPDHLLHGKCGCTGCLSEKIYDALALTHEEFVKRMAEINSNVIIVGKYNGTHNAIHVKCKKCGFEWNPSAGSLLNGNGCPHCVGRHKTTEEFKLEIAQVNPYINIIGEYIDSKTIIECECNICGHHWVAKPSSLLYTGCPKCNMSKGERKIAMFLDAHNIDYVYIKTFEGLLGVKGRNLSYDFMINNSNILIEYQGEFHDGTARQQTEEEFLVQQEHDRRKKEYAIKNNYKLIEIWYWDFDNINEILERELC